MRIEDLRHEAREERLSATLHIYPATEAMPWHYHFDCPHGHEESGTLESLDALADVLRRWGRHLVDLPWTVLPTFGGAAPARTEGVWSWDDSRVLVGSDVHALTLCPREQT